MSSDDTVIVLDRSEIEHVYAWVVAVTGTNRVMAVFYRVRDDAQLHVQIHQTTRSREDPSYCEIDFQRARCDVNDHHRELHVAAKLICSSIGAGNPYIYPVDGDVDAALKILQESVVVQQGNLH